MITIKTPAEIAIMTEGGKKLAIILDRLSDYVKIGITTAEIEKRARELFQESGGEPTFLGFHDFPASTCISVNDEIVHGIPGKRIIKDGDLVGIDAGLRYKGFCTDTATTVAVGTISPEAHKLLEITERSLRIGLTKVKPGNRIGDVGHAIQEVIENAGFGIVKDLTGHGIGRDQWEEPAIPNFGKPGTGAIIKEGMTLAIEPMVTLGDGTVQQLNDGWTISSLDGSLAAHFEHTVVVTKNGCKVLT